MADQFGVLLDRRGPANQETLNFTAILALEK